MYKNIRSLKMDLPPNQIDILEKEYSTEFDKKRMNAVLVSYHIINMVLLKRTLRRAW